jgi:hypothetical protein
MINGPTLTNYNLFDDVKELDNDIQRSCDPEIWSTMHSYIATTRFELDSLRCGLPHLSESSSNLVVAIYECIVDHISGSQDP